MDGPNEKVLKFVDPSKPDINEGCVNTLREALQRAKNGEVHGVAICLAVVDPDSPSGRGSIHLTTWSAKFKDTLYTGVGAMLFSMQAEMHCGVEKVERMNEEDITDD